MPEETDPTLNFLSNVHKTLAKTDELIELMKTTYEVLLEVPGIPEESLTFAIDTINNMTELKVLVKGLVEHSNDMNDAMDNVIKEIESRITKK